jgi:hypothetical protein
MLNLHPTAAPKEMSVANSTNPFAIVFPSRSSPKFNPSSAYNSLLQTLPSSFARGASKELGKDVIKLGWVSILFLWRRTTRIIRVLPGDPFSTLRVGDDEVG